jgi:misacylated tRNA(Ala) deacylase
MTEAKYLKDCYLKEYKTKILEANGKFIVLEQSIFYPESGGQPSDFGSILNSGKEYKVILVKKLPDKINIEVDKEGLMQGDEVDCIVDWNRRYKFMRSHTAAHILSEVIRKETGARITGNQIGEEKIRVDLDLESFDKDKIKTYIEKANEIIRKGLPVKTYFMEREEAFKNPELFGLKNVLPPEVKELRLVELEGFDIKACGGTHIANTSEIKGIEFISAENKGKSNRRIYFKLVD